MHTDEEEVVPYEYDGVDLLTLGIDIGSTTTQMAFSRLRLQRLPGALSSTFTLVGRSVVYRAPIVLTPFAANRHIDEDALRSVVAAGFRGAGIAPSEIDSGAVVVTGEAARQVNARIVASAVAATAGRFVCAVAGHHLEAELAAFGSGAVAISQRDGSAVLNIDIGGATTKFSAIENGEIVQTAALHVGGRHAIFADDGRIAQLEPACAALAHEAGVAWETGTLAAPVALRQVAGAMADAVVAGASGLPDVAWVTQPLAPREYAAIVFSGGVSEYLYDDSWPSFADLGPALGRGLRDRFVRLPGAVVPGEQRITSTVLGASQYTVQLSGNTVFVADPAALPLHDLHVVRVAVPTAQGEIAAELTRQFHEQRERYVPAGAAFATMVAWHGLPAFERLDAVRGALAALLADEVRAGRPVLLAFDADIARLFGRMLARTPGFETAAIVSLDGLVLSGHDFVDIGPLAPSGTVAVTIKSLVFWGER